MVMVLLIWLLIVILTALPIIFLLNRWPLSSSSGKPRRPPGPPGLPFIGNLLQYSPSNLHVSLANLSNKYGPLMYMELIGKPALVISSAKIAKEALKQNDLAFSDRPTTITMSKLSYNGRDITGSPYTPYWREMRKMVVLHLFTHKQVNSFRAVREDEVLRTVGAISRQATGDLVNLNEAALSLSSNIICRVAFGKRYDGEGRRFSRLLEDIQSVLMEFFVADCFPWLIWIDRLRGKVSRLEKVFEDMDSFYQDVIDEHLSPNRPDSMDGDILDLLIRLREEGSSSSVRIDWEHIKAILMDVSVAGSDTSAATITWAMTALIKKPSALQKVQEEIRGFVGNKGKVDEDDIDKLPYLKAVIKETLRLYPPGPLSLRETRMPCIVNGYEIEAKAIAFINLWAIGRDPDYWENPTEFIPERFLNSEIDFKGQDFGFIPFGSGRRQCPGLALGVAQIEMALANILYSFDWELPPGMVEDDVDTDCLPGAAMLKKNALYLRAKNYQQ